MSLLLRLVAVSIIRVAWDGLIHVGLWDLIRIGVLATKESSLSHAFGLRVDDACLLLWWGALRLGEVHNTLLYALISNWSWGARVIEVILIFVLHLIGQSLLKLHLLLHLLLLVCKYRVFTLSTVCNHWHLLLLLHLIWIIGLDDGTHKLAIGVAHLVLGWRSLYRVGDRSRVVGGKVLLFSVETTAKVHHLSFTLGKQHLVVHRWVVMTLRALMEFHLVVLIRVVVDRDRLPVQVVLANSTASSLDWFLTHDVLMEGWSSHCWVMFIHDLLGYLTVGKILLLLGGLHRYLLAWQWSSLRWSQTVLVEWSLALYNLRVFKLLNTWVVHALSWCLSRWRSIRVGLPMLDGLPRLFHRALRLLLLHHVLLMNAIQVCADMECWLRSYLLLLM